MCIAQNEKDSAGLCWEVREALGPGPGWLSLEGSCQGAQEGRFVVAELLFSQQLRKLWIMSMVVLGKQVQWNSQLPRLKTRSDVCLVWAVGSGGWWGWGEIGGRL